MTAAPFPQNEARRLQALRRLNILDTPPDPGFDDLTRLASYICGTPMALVSLIDEGRQWFKSAFGIDATEGPREQAFCAHAILGNELFEVRDARDDVRFADNPAVVGEPPIRFYAGAPLITSRGEALGTLCVVDHQPRVLSQVQRDALSALARQAMAYMEQLERTADAQLLRDVAMVANNAVDTEEVLQAVLVRICNHMDWPVGHVYLKNDASGELAPTAMWHLADPRFEPFRAYTMEHSLVPGIGVAGRVLATRGAAWATHKTAPVDAPRRSLGIQLGLRTMMAFPVLVGTEVVAVLECISPDEIAPDAARLEIMAQIGTLLGRTVERARAEAALAASEAHTRRILETASEAFVAMDASGTIVDWNRQAEATFGWSREEALGSRLAERLIPPEHRAAHATGMARVLAGGAPRIIGKRVELPALHRDGHTIPVELFVWLVESGGAPTFNAFLRDVSERKAAEVALRNANAELMRGLARLERRNQEVSLLNKLGEKLQACRDEADARAVVAELVRRIFPTLQGSVGVIDPAKGLVEPISVWGGARAAPYAPADCYALRRGFAHRASASRSVPRCAHGEAGAGPQICVPMMAQAEPLGVLHLALSGQTEDDDAVYQLAASVTEHIALALSNLRLRETLRYQSVRDPLTGLFNRRFLEESLSTELVRCRRHKHELTLVAVDVDHFKRFNDTFGHDGGDALLRALADYLRGAVRANDVVCRVGGEEFVVLLAEGAENGCLARVEAIREGVKTLSVTHRGESLGPVTISVGVSACPANGYDAAELLRAADEALYKAKAAGRDCVVTAASVRPASLRAIATR